MLLLSWSTVIFDLTIQAMADSIYDLFAERMRFRIHSLEEILSSQLGEQDPPTEDDEPFVCDSEEEVREEEEEGEESETLLTAPQEYSSEELAELEKEYSWFQNFYSKIQDIRNSKGVPASVKWNRMKRGDPLLNERSTLNYMKSMEENHR
jgi:hypothetical protein